MVSGLSAFPTPLSLPARQIAHQQLKCSPNPPAFKGLSCPSLPDHPESVTLPDGLQQGFPVKHAPAPHVSHLLSLTPRPALATCPRPLCPALLPSAMKCPTSNWENLCTTQPLALGRIHWLYIPPPRTDGCSSEWQVPTKDRAEEIGHGQCTPWVQLPAAASACGAALAVSSTWHTTAV